MSNPHHAGRPAGNAGFDSSYSGSEPAAMPTTSTSHRKNRKATFDSKPDGTPDPDLLARCTRALQRRAAREGGTFDQPSSARSGWRKGAFQLENTRGVIARFRIKNGRIAGVERPSRGTT